MSQNGNQENIRIQNDTETIFLSPSNNVSTVNNIMALNFPIPYFSRGDEIALSNLFMYYSWNNVSLLKFNNTSCTYTWVDGTVNLVSFPDGFYTIDNISAYINFVQTTNTHYLTSTTPGALPNLYYTNLAANPVYYAVTLTELPVPTSLPTGYSLPSGAAWSLPSPAKVPLLTISGSNNFGSLIGFAAGTYPAVTQATEYQINGTLVPNISPVSAINVRCNFVNKPSFNTIGDTIYTFSPNVSFGSQIQEKPPYLNFFACQDGYYTQLIITFSDQNGNPLGVQDTNTVLTLAIKRNSKKT